VPPTTPESARTQNESTRVEKLIALSLSGWGVTSVTPASESEGCPMSDASALLDENGRVDISKVRSRAKSQGGGRNEAVCISRQTCIRIRNRLRIGGTVTQVAERVGVGKTTVSNHAAGKCSCDHNHPPVVKGWHTTERTGGGGDHSHLPAVQCKRFRRELLNGATVSEVSRESMACKHTIRRHAKGECSHSQESAKYPPLAYGWHEVDE